MFSREKEHAKIPITSWTTRGKVWIDPREELEYDIRHGTSAERYSQSCILCFQRDLVSLAIEHSDAKKADRLLGCNYYEFIFKGKRIGIIQSGIGAPMAALILERLIVRGVDRVVSTGIRGSLNI